VTLWLQTGPCAYRFIIASGVLRQSKKQVSMTSWTSHNLTSRQDQCIAVCYILARSLSFLRHPGNFCQLSEAVDMGFVEFSRQLGKWHVITSAKWELEGLAAATGRQVVPPYDDLERGVSRLGGSDSFAHHSTYPVPWQRCFDKINDVLIGVKE